MLLIQNLAFGSPEVLPICRFGTMVHEECQQVTQVKEKSFDSQVVFCPLGIRLQQTALLLWQCIGAVSEHFDFVKNYV